MPYLVNRSHIHLVNAAHPIQTEFQWESLSLNWSSSDSSLEVVDGLSGKTTERLELVFIILEIIVSFVLCLYSVHFQSYTWKPQCYPDYLVLSELILRLVVFLEIL